MKKILPFLGLFVILSSCQMKNEVNSTPSLRFSYFIHSHEAKTDTLFASVTAENVYTIDSVYALDTISFLIGADGGYNEIDSLIVQWDTTAMQAAFTVDQSWTSILDASKTDVARGRFFFYPYVQSIVIPMTYVPIKSGSQSISIHLANTSTFAPKQVTFIQPVR